MNFDLRSHTILLAVAGSHAYGMATAASDIDVKGIAIPPKRYYLGVTDRFDQADKPSALSGFIDCMSEHEQNVIKNTKLEGSVYELQKFISLALDANPNILDALFCRDEEVRLSTPAGKKLREEAASLFISAKAKFTFSGYAHSQLKRIKTHRRWLMNPPSHRPAREEYSLPEQTLIPKTQLEAVWSMITKKMDSWQFDFDVLNEPDRLHIMSQIEKHLSEIGATTEDRWKNASRAIGFDEHFILLLDRERQYNAALAEWNNYQTWKTQRNEDRALLEAQFGFDTKHAAHLVRLLRMAREILSEGKVNVWRGGIDAEELLGIRRGAWAYESLVEWAEKEDAELDEIYKKKLYVVPGVPDRKRADALCMKIIEESWNDV